MARYDVRNDGAGPYAVFYCDRCSREFRSQPNVKGTVAQTVTRSAFGGLLRGVPVIGDIVDSTSSIQDPRYVTTLSPEALSGAWSQMASVFHECPTCQQLVCPSDWDAQSGFCTDDTPRRQDIAEAQAEQAGAMVKGFAEALGLGGKLRDANLAQGAVIAACASCGASTNNAKFCPNCGTPVPQATGRCGSCGAETKGAKFCPECGARQGVV
jgi:hypothetical protein